MGRFKIEQSSSGFNFEKKSPKKRYKYNNKKTIVDGVMFDSIKESKYYLLLKNMLAKKEIIGFKRQIRTKTPPGITYVVDFVVEYTDREEYWDVKGYKTQEYKNKKKLMKYFYGIDIIEK